MFSSFSKVSLEGILLLDWKFILWSVGGRIVQDSESMDPLMAERSGEEQ